MRLDPAGRVYAVLDLTVDADPISDTIELLIDEAWHPMEWTADATSTTVGGVITWTRSARLLVAGPDAADNPAGTVVLALGRHLVKYRLTDSPELVVDRRDAIDVS